MLQLLSGRAFYLPGSNNLGVVTTSDGGAILIDTGLDRDVAKQVRKALDAAKLRLIAIINTHHHADHIGGNDYLLRNIPHVQVYAPPLEAALIMHPLLEPIYLSMGAAPVAALQNKWLMAKPSPVHSMISEPRLTIADVEFEVIPLAGHSLAQIGLVVDGVCFAADGFFGPAVLEKHGIPYAQDVAGQLASLEYLVGRSEDWFIPGHGHVCEREALHETIAVNKAAIERASATVRAALSEPGDLATIGRRVRQILNLNPGGLPQYAIFLSAISAHLGYLEAQGAAKLVLTDDGMVWQKPS